MFLATGHGMTTFATYRARISTEAAISWFDIIDGEIVAMGALRRALGGAEIKRMRVDPAFQRRGFGRHILRLLQERAPELGYRRLQLDVGPNLTAALSLYAAEGFVEVGRGEIGGSLAIFLAKNLW
jgi:ribosomal protein S18 acetylase RimI-like enzyme